LSAVRQEKNEPVRLSVEHPGEVGTVVGCEGLEIEFREKCRARAVTPGAP
jgi:hypothetical protein